MDTVSCRALENYRSADLIVTFRGSDPFPIHQLKTQNQSVFVCIWKKFDNLSFNCCNKTPIHLGNREGEVWYIILALWMRKELLKLGPAPASGQDRTDIVDEAITFFRANVFFRNFDIKSSADKLLIYLTFYINVALKRLEGCRTLAEGTKAIINLGLEKVPVPGESGFPFPGLFPLPQSQQEAELLRNYLKQIREETSGRLLSVAYRPNGTPNKWWLAFAKRKFMNIIVP
nr:actin-related protein 2/3 complex subunit 3 [Quercus suber]